MRAPSELWTTRELTHISLERAVEDFQTTKTPHSLVSDLAIAITSYREAKKVVGRVGVSASNKRELEVMSQIIHRWDSTILLVLHTVYT